jgi:hypothetical protein
MALAEIIAVCCEDHTRHSRKLHKQNLEMAKDEFSVLVE